jgi:hypothetical protein
MATILTGLHDQHRREMRAISFATDDVVGLLVATLALVVPPLLTIMPFEQLLTQSYQNHLLTLTEGNILFARIADFGRLIG